MLPCHSDRNTTVTTGVALVTGSRKGLGRFVAEQLVADGYRVVGCSRQPAEWSAAGYEHVMLDVADELGVGRLLAHVRRSYGRLDAVVNNAGVASMNHALLTPASSLDEIYRTNVRGTFVVSRDAARLMRAGGGGRIVNVSSVAARLDLEGEAAYAASKSAVESLTRVLARELAPFHITVNAVGPPPIETDLIRGVPPEKINAIVARQAIRRLGQPEDVYNVIRFLLRPESAFVTGQVIYLGGV